MYNVQRSAARVQCPMFNVDLLNVQCTMCNKQRPVCNVQGARAMQTSNQLQLNNQLSTGSTVGSPWPGLRYQFGGSNKCNQSKKQPHEVSSREIRFGAAFSHQRRHGSSVVTSPSHLRRLRWKQGSHVPAVVTNCPQSSNLSFSMSWSDIHRIETLSHICFTMFHIFHISQDTQDTSCTSCFGYDL